MIVYGYLKVVSGLDERILVHFAVITELNQLFRLTSVHCYPAFIPILVLNA